MKLIEKIKKIIEENGAKVNDNGSIENMDSLSFIATIVQLEEEFDIEFPDMYLTSEKLNKVDSIIYIVNELLSDKGLESNSLL